MAALGIADAHDKAMLGQVDLGLAHHRVFGILEIDGNDAAHRAGCLVHQTAGLAEENILGILADLGNADLPELLHIIVIVLAAEDGPDTDLKGSRAGKAGAPQHVAGGVGIKAAHLAAVVEDPHRHAADQGRGMLGFPGLRRADAQVHIVDFFKTVGLDPHNIVLVG